MSSKTTESLQSQAPTRIDLAGGTVDIWPIYLFLPEARTINLGINLFAEVKLTAKPGRGLVKLESSDQKATRELSWTEILQGGAIEPGLALHTRLLRYFALELQTHGRLDLKTDFTLSTRAQSPAGAGLGGSSTLSIALIGALATWARGPFDKKRDGERFIEIVRDTETTVIQVPAGMQDYYGAMYGGLQSLHWKPGTNEHHHLPATLLLELQKRLILFYSGQSRNSGINNWALFKAFIDKDAEVRRQFGEIAAATLDVEAALLAKDWKAVGQGIHREWDTRRTLAPGIATAEIDQAFAAGMKVGATAGKICGAGGGGCFFLYEPTGAPNARARIEQAVLASGANVRPLPFQAAPEGLEVWRSDF